MSRSEVISRIKSLEQSVLSEEIGNVKKKAEWCLEKVLEFKFYPLLDKVFDIKQKIFEKENAKDEEMLAIFMRQSEFIKSTKSSELFENFMNASKTSENLTFTVPENLNNISPINAKVSFNSQEIFTGKEAQINVSFISSLAKTVNVSEISATLKDNNGSEFSEIICENAELNPGILLNIKKPFVPRSSIKGIEIENIKVKINNFSILLKVQNVKLKITPNEDSCKIDVSMPERCIIGTKLPLTVTLLSGENMLKDLVVSLLYDDKQAVVLSGTYNGKPIEKETSIGDVEAKTSVILDLTIMTQIPLSTAIILSVSFSTDQFDRAVFKRPLKFKFIPPFSGQFKYYNSDFDLLNDKVIVMDKGTPINVETSITNVLSIPLTVKNIGGIAISNSTELPATVNSNETFTFFGKITKPGVGDITIEYAAHDIDTGIFCLRTQEIIERNAPFKFTYLHPNEAVVNQEFDVKLIIEKGDDAENPKEFTEILLTVEKTPYFFLSGSGKQSFVLSRNQKKEVSLRFLPLETGSAYIPSIHVFDPKNRAMQGNIFKAPIIVAYQ